MARRIFVLVLLLTAMTATSSVPLGAREPVQASRVTFTEVTRVCGYFLMGTYVIVHDDAKMAAGEPCTTIYKIRDGQPAEATVSFHCIPRQRGLVASTTLTTIPSMGTTTGTRTVDLVEYQIAGDTEAHGVPETAAHGR